MKYSLHASIALIGLSVLVMVLLDFSVQQSYGQPSPLNSTTGSINITSSSIKYFATITPLTIEPPIVQPRENFNISGRLINFITGNPIAKANISFNLVPSEAIDTFTLRPLIIPQITSAITDSNGYFKVNTTAPRIMGSTVFISAYFGGNSQYYPIASIPVTVVIPNTMRLMG